MGGTRTGAQYSGAGILRLVLPTEADRRAGIRVNARRAGALLVVLRDDFLTRLQSVSNPGTVQTRRIAEEAVRSVLSSEPKT